MIRLMKVTFFIILFCLACEGQSKYNNQIQPGLSTRADVDSALGQPLRAISANQFEYAPPAGATRLSVVYRNGSNVVELIQLDFPATPRASMLQALKLPERPEALAVPQGHLVEYYGGDRCLSLTYASLQAASGVITLGYYSRELFDQQVSKLTSRTSAVYPSAGSTPSLSGGAGGGAAASLPVAGGKGFSPRLDDTTYLGGVDIRNFVVNSIDECESACAAEARCVGYVFGKPGARPYSARNNLAVCALKSQLGQAGHNTCCTSATKNR